MSGYDTRTRYNMFAITNGTLMRGSEAFRLVVVLILSLLPTFTAGEDFQNRLRADYQGRLLTLRHFCTGDHLLFNSRGDSTCETQPGSWTTDGQVLIDNIELKGRTLHVEGRRKYLFYDGTQKTFRDVLTVTKGEPAANLFTHLPDRDWQKRIEDQQKVEIEIILDSDSPELKDLSSALMAVFLEPGAAMSSVLPTFWRAYFVHQETGIESPPDSAEPVYHVKPGEVSLPRRISTPDPEYSEVARQVGYSGTVVLALIVDPTGTPRDVQIAKPARLGFDEKAVDAVSTWKFEPAQKDARPVSVLLQVDVSFSLN